MPYCIEYFNAGMQMFNFVPYLGEILVLRKIRKPEYGYAN